MNRSKFFRVSMLAAIGWALILQASLAFAGVSPPLYQATMAPGDSNDVAKIVGTPAIPPRPDIIFLADTTGSMGVALTNVKTNAAAIMTAVDAGTSGTPFFAAAEYRDFGDSFVFVVNHGLTSDQAAVNAAIGTWNANEGGDTPEAQLNALGQLATGAAGAFRENATPVIVWFGDASGHDPSGVWTEVLATAALEAEEIIVIAIGVTGANGLNATGQAARIAAATGGSYAANTSPGDVAQAILDALSNLPVTVIPTPVGCDPLVVIFDPTTDTVTSGDDASFTETIAVPSSSAVAGQFVDCRVDFEDENGNALGSQDIEVTIPLAIDLSPDTAVNELSEDNSHTVTAYVSSLDVDLLGKEVDFTVTGTNATTATPNAGTGTSPTDANGEAIFSYTVPTSCNSLGTDTITGCTDRADLGADECNSVLKDWGDTTAPVAECVETVNPNGSTKPAAPGKGDQGQNQDGFYELLAEDNLVDDCAPLELFVTDMGSGTVFGPLEVGTKVKYTQDIDATPEIKKMGGKKGNADAIDWHIIGTGDMQLNAVDQSGNTSTPVECLVPPPPQ